jgi:polar amino acid transport system substrate-binding protein
MIPGLAGRRWDMINTGIFWTEERARLIYMIPYERAGIAFLAPRGNPLNIARVQDLAGRRVAVELGGLEERRTREISQELVGQGLRPIDIRTFASSAEIFQVLRAGQVEAATGIDATAMFMQQRGDFSRVISGLLPQVATLAVGNRDLAQAVVAALNEMRRDGFYGALFDRYGVLQIEEPEFAVRGPGPA